MADKRPHPLTTANLLIRLVSVLAICGTVIWLILFLTGFWEGAKAPVGTVKDVGRAVTRIEQPRKEGVPANEADAKDIAAAVAIDSEGERVDLLAEAQLELIDITLRTHARFEKKLSYRTIVAKALTWVPDNWKYPKRWQDRDAVITEMARSESVKELIPIVLKRMESGPREGCAAKIIRAKGHFFGWLGGEGGAAKIIATYPKDSRFEGKGFRTDFRCLPN